MTTPARAHPRDFVEHEFPANPVHSLAGRDVATERDDFFIRTPRVARLLAFLADVAVIAAMAVATLATLVWRSATPTLTSRDLLALLLLYSITVTLALRALHLYIRPRRAGMFGDVATITWAIGFATVAVLSYLWLTDGPVRMTAVGTAGALDWVGLVGWRALRMRIAQQRVAAGKGTRNVLIVGAGRVGRSLAGYLDRNPQLGYAVRGFLDAHQNGDARVLGGLERLRSVVRTDFIEEVIITIPSERQLVQQVVAEAQAYGVRVKVVPELFDGLGLQAPIDYVGRFPTMELHRQPIPVAGLWAKRAIDLAAVSVGIVLTAPLMALVALAIRLDSRGPVLYRSLRVGKKGKRFTCYKFRSMITDADAVKEELRRSHNYRSGPTFKIENDPRITPLGRFLRQYSLDELPQLFNVLRGEMSLVGPRPHPLDDFQQYDTEHMARLMVKPGLTGLWQVVARRDPSFETNMRLDLEYIENWTLLLDFKILAMTLPAVLRGNGQ